MSAQVLRLSAPAILAVALSLTHLAVAQTIQVDNQTVAATNVTVAPAVANVSTGGSTSGAEYFSFEAVQLTPEVLANLTSLNLTNIDQFVFGNTSTLPSKRSAARCKVFPGDSDWPWEIDWFILDLLLGGALIQTTPQAAVCYSDWPEYDEDACTTVTNEWTSPTYQMDDPTGIDWPLFEGMSCMPPSLGRTDGNCTQGGYPSYVVNATNVAQIQLAVNFARNLNVRLVIKNKGHDFLGKSVGAGALSVLTNYLQDIQYLADYTAGGVTGPAFKIGAGVDIQQIYTAADALGLEVVGGVARTVGIAGGYIAGGGHSPLTPVYGMAADQVLALEVVLSDGSFVTVTQDKYPDLFWALRGGGGSTFGIVTSLIIRAYPKMPVTTLTYSFSTGTNVTNVTFWQGVDAFWQTFPSMSKAGQYRYWILQCTSETDCSLTMSPHWANNMTSAQVAELNAPFFAQLADLGIPVQDVTYAEYDGVLSAFDVTFPESTEAVGAWTYHTASRLFPQANWENATTLAAQSNILRESVLAAGMMIGYNIQPAVNPRVNQTNAVNPPWRYTLLHCMIASVWNASATNAEIAAANEALVELMNPWRDISPTSGVYNNEGDVNEPNPTQAFYGDAYPQLYALKQAYDPWGVFYAATAVGSEDWYITDQIPYLPTQTGRLCPVQC